MPQFSFYLRFLTCLEVQKSGLWIPTGFYTRLKLSNWIQLEVKLRLNPSYDSDFRGILASPDIRLCSLLRPILTQKYGKIQIHVVLHIRLAAAQTQTWTKCQEKGHNGKFVRLWHLLSDPTRRWWVNNRPDFLVHTQFKKSKRFKADKKLRYTNIVSTLPQFGQDYYFYQINI